jgi:hypothetical protein
MAIPVFTKRITSMNKRLIHLLGTLIFAGMTIIPDEASAGILVGGTMSVSLDDTPAGNDFTGNFTVQAGVGNTTAVPSADMTLTESLYNTAPGVQWLVLDIEATNGHLLAGNLNGYWSIGATLPLASPSGFTGAFGYWSVNGSPTNPIDSFIGGFLDHPNQTDPVDSSIYPVYADIFPSAIASGTTSLPLPNLIYMSDYSYYLPQGGMNPNAVNGFVIGMQVTSSAIPEPSSLCLAAAAAAMGGFALVRPKARRRAAQGGKPVRRFPRP